MESAYFVSAPQLREKRTFNKHRLANPADYRPRVVSADPAKHPRRHLQRKRSLRPRQQVDGLAFRPAATQFVDNGNGRQQYLRLGHVAGNAK